MYSRALILGFSFSLMGMEKPEEQKVRSLRELSAVAAVYNDAQEIIMDNLPEDLHELIEAEKYLRDLQKEIMDIRHHFIVSGDVEKSEECVEAENLVRKALLTRIHNRTCDKQVARVKGSVLWQRDRALGRFLLAAVARRELVKVKALVALGAPLEGITPIHVPLHTATMLGLDKRIIGFLLENGANVNAISLLGDTALVEAIKSITCERKQICKDVIEILLERGADASISNVFGETALSWAQAGGHEDIVELLLQERI